MTIFQVRNDPGHGWLIVTRAQLADVGLTEGDISPYSFADPHSDELGLEEDMDAMTFYHAWLIKYGEPFETRSSEDGANLRIDWAGFGTRAGGPEADAKSKDLQEKAAAARKAKLAEDEDATDDEEDEENQEITARIATVDERLAFLPHYVPRQFMVFENTVYGFADKFSEDYDGGLWTFVHLSNGGFFIHPDTEKIFDVKCWGNHFEGTLTAEAYGIGLTLFALSHLSFDKAAQASIPHRYQELYAFAARHTEAGQIFSFID